MRTSAVVSLSLLLLAGGAAGQNIGLVQLESMGPTQHRGVLFTIRRPEGNTPVDKHFFSGDGPACVSRSDRIIFRPAHENTFATIFRYGSSTKGGDALRPSAMGSKLRLVIELAHETVMACSSSSLYDDCRTKRVTLPVLRGKGLDWQLMSTPQSTQGKCGRYMPDLNMLPELTAQTASLRSECRSTPRDPACAFYLPLLEERRQDLEQFARFQSATPPEAPAVHGLAVGISEYRWNRSASTIPGAAADANLFDEYLRALPTSKRNPVRTKLINSDATAGRIRRELRNILFRTAQSGDTVLLLLAAHGVTSRSGQTGYLMAYDSRPGIQGSYLLFREIQGYAEVAARRGVKVLLFIDACHAGLADQPGLPQKAIHRRLQADLTDTDVPLSGILSSRRGELSSDDNKSGHWHGTFTSNLVEAMWTGVGDLQTLYDRVADLMKGTGQHPVVFGPREVTLPGAAAQDRHKHCLERMPVRTADEDILMSYLEGEDLAPDRASITRAAAHYAEVIKNQDFAADPQLVLWKTVLEAKSDMASAAQIVDSGEYGARLRDALRSLEAYATSLGHEAALDNAAGLLHLELGEYAQAERAFREAASWDPLWPHPRHNLAFTLTEVGRYEEAATEYRNSIRVARTFGEEPASAHHNLGALLYRLGDDDEALAEFRRAINLFRGMRVKNEAAAKRSESRSLLAAAALSAARGELKRAQGFINEARGAGASPTALEVLCKSVPNLDCAPKNKNQ